MTAIRVVVERIMPSSVKKVRSLLDRNESNATEAASRKDAWEGFTDFVPRLSCRLFQDTRIGERLFDMNASVISSTQSSTSSSTQKRGRWRAMNPTCPP